MIITFLLCLKVTSTLRKRKRNSGQIMLPKLPKFTAIKIMELAGFMSVKKNSSLMLEELFEHKNYILISSMKYELCASHFYDLIQIRPDFTKKAVEFIKKFYLSDKILNIMISKDNMILLGYNMGFSDLGLKKAVEDCIKKNKGNLFVQLVYYINQYYKFNSEYIYFVYNDAIKMTSDLDYIKLMVNSIVKIGYKFDYYFTYLHYLNIGNMELVEFIIPHYLEHRKDSAASCIYTILYMGKKYNITGILNILVDNYNLMGSKDIIDGIVKEQYGQNIEYKYIFDIIDRIR
jgi:hypothetical protein